MRQRMRAPLRLATPPSRISQQGTLLRSEATASRRLAVKSSAAGSPQISPITQDRAAHLSPSSIAHSAERASRVSTWTISCTSSPGGWIRPDSRIAIRSCTHRMGLDRSVCARRKPAQPVSRGCSANSSQRVGPGGAGKRQRSPTPVGRARKSPIWGMGEPARRFSAGPELVETAPPATRDKPFATRLTTLLFYFCSFPARSGKESMARLGG